MWKVLNYVGLTEPLVEYDGVDDVFFVYHEMLI